jgi:hypothetical protein
VQDFVIVESITSLVTLLLIQQWKTILREKWRVACLTLGLEPGQDRKFFFT